jgi:hypothetical protein
MINVRPLKAYRGTEVQRLSFFTSALGVVDQRETSAGIYSVGGWAGPKPGLNSSEKGEICCPYRDSNPGSLCPSLVTAPTALPW